MTNHVPSLTTCQKLKAKGFTQETEFTWYYDEQNDDIPALNWTDLGRVVGGVGYYTDHYSAPLLTEILDQLPVTFRSGPPWKLPIDLRLTRRTPPINGDTKWDVWYGTAHWNIYMIKSDRSSAEAAAQLWLKVNHD